jgi:hypothetical protein
MLFPRLLDGSEHARALRVAHLDLHAIAEPEEGRPRRPFSTCSTTRASIRHA